MCIQSRILYNRWIDDYMRIDCGHCPSCQQIKAQRITQRIRDTKADYLIPLFVTLTYAPAYLPYIVREEISVKQPFLNIYRDATCRYVRVSNRRTKYGLSLHRSFKTVVLDSVSVDYLSRGAFSQFDLGAVLSNMQSAKGSNDNCYGVIYYKDLQDFFKRLKIDLLRNYGYDTSHDYISFQCAEYGPSTFRPHFHFLLWCPLRFEEAVRRSICKNWPFADRSRTAEYIEIARDAASYVSSYCNRPADFPSFLAQRPFRPRHSFSKMLGFNNDLFSLSTVNKMVERGSFEIHREIVDESGCKLAVAVSLPKYVINRYYPKIKGFANLYANTDCDGFRIIAKYFLQDIVGYMDYISDLQETEEDFWFGTTCDTSSDGDLLSVGEIHEESADLSTLNTILFFKNNIPIVVREDYRENFLRLYNAYLRNNELLEYPITYDDYLLQYYRVWKTWSFTQLRLWYSHMTDFETIAESYEYPEISKSALNDYLLSHGFESAILRNMICCLPSDVNKHPLRVQSTIQKEFQFAKKVKQRKVINSVMSANGRYV